MMQVVPQMLCLANQWPAEAFWHNVTIATGMVEREMTMVCPSSPEIEQMILRSWLDYATPAGNA